MRKSDNVWLATVDPGVLCDCADDGPACAWHVAQRARIRGLYAHEYSDAVLEELTRPEAPQKGVAA